MRATSRGPGSTPAGNQARIPGRPAHFHIPYAKLGLPILSAWSKILSRPIQSTDPNRRIVQRRLLGRASSHRLVKAEEILCHAKRGVGGRGRDRRGPRTDMKFGRRLHTAPETRGAKGCAGPDWPARESKRHTLPLGQSLIQ